MAAKTRYTIKNLVTGFTFDLTKEECDKLVIEEPYNFEVIDKDYVSPVGTVEAETSTYSQVVVGENEETPKVRGLDEYSYNELKKFAKENNLKQSGKKEELLARCVEYTKQKAAEQELNDQPEQIADVVIENND